MSLNDKATAALTRELAKCFPERDANDPGHAKLAAALSDTAHTPGPWEVVDDTEDPDVTRCVKGSHGEYVCVPLIQDANLIAAAPCMFTALKASEIIIEHLRARLRGEDTEPLDIEYHAAKIRAAIARATGGVA